MVQKTRELDQEAQGLGSRKSKEKIQKGRNIRHKIKGAKQPLTGNYRRQPNNTLERGNWTLLDCILGFFGFFAPIRLCLFLSSEITMFMFSYVSATLKVEIAFSILHLVPSCEWNGPIYLEAACAWVQKLNSRIKFTTWNTPIKNKHLILAKHKLLLALCRAQEALVKVNAELNKDLKYEKCQCKMQSSF